MVDSITWAMSDIMVLRVVLRMEAALAPTGLEELLDASDGYELRLPNH